MAKYQDTVETLISARNEVASELRAAERQMQEVAAREKQRAKEEEAQLRNRAAINRRIQEDLSRQADERDRKRIAFADELANTEQSIRDTSLRAAGNALQADIEQLRAHFDKRIAIAKEANQTELAARLTALRNLKEKDLRGSHGATTAARDRRIQDDLDQQAEARESRKLQVARNRAAIERRINDDLAAQAEEREKRNAEFARDSAGVQRQIQDSRLRASGQHLQADLMQVRAGFAQRIAAAQAANQTELVNRLRTLQTIREQEARAAHMAARESAGGNGGGLTGRIRGLSSAAKLLVGGGVLAGFDMMGKRLAHAVEKSAELVEQFKAGAISARQLTAGLLQGIPVLGGWIEAGGKIRAWLDGSIERMNALNKAAEKGNEALAEMRKQFAANAALRDTDRSVSEDIAVNDRQGAARKVLEIEQKLARDIEEVKKKAKEAQRDADDPQTARTIALLRERAAQEASKAVGDELTEKRNAEVARQRAAEQSEAEIAELRMRQQGKTLEAELHAIRTATAERVKAAKEANNATLAANEERLGKMKEQEARVLDQRREQIEDIERQREGIEKQMREDAEALNRAKSRADVAGPAAADQNRFLTGVRQESDRADQAMKTDAQKQIKALEQSLETQKLMMSALQKLVEEIQKAPIVRVDGEDI